MLVHFFIKAAQRWYHDHAQPRSNAPEELLLYSEEADEKEQRKQQLNKYAEEYNNALDMIDKEQLSKIISKLPTINEKKQYRKKAKTDALSIDLKELEQSSFTTHTFLHCALWILQKFTLPFYCTVPLFGLLNSGLHYYKNPRYPPYFFVLTTAPYLGYIYFGSLVTGCVSTCMVAEVIMQLIWALF
jgi:hypothetical protein